MEQIPRGIDRIFTLSTDQAAPSGARPFMSAPGLRKAPRLGPAPSYKRQAASYKLQAASHKRQATSSKRS